MAVTSRVCPGTNIFDEKWDLCIILDACRVDALRAVSSEYSFLHSVEIGSTMSVGSSSKEWLVNTFHERNRAEIEKTTYLTGNGWAEVVFSDDSQFENWTVTKGTIASESNFVGRLAWRPTVSEDDFENVYHQSLSDVGGIPALRADELADMSIVVGRDSDAERMIVHFMQPHEPFLGRATDAEPTEVDKNPYDYLRSGGSKDKVWEAYLDNLRYVLDQVGRLLKNFDGDAVITADHGEMFGPAPLFGHAEGIPHPKLKWVPWVELEATDTGSDYPDVEIEPDVSDDVDERLAALGYL